MINPGFIKICGIRNYDDAAAAIDFGADAIGFNFYLKSKRYVHPEIACQIISKLGRQILTVGVFVNSSASDVNAIRNALLLDLVQFHGDETSVFVNNFESCIKVIRVSDENSDSAFDVYKTDYLMFDSASAIEYGGTGRVFHWKNFNFPPLKKNILSGGLNSQNVAEAISCVRPWGVDVCSGVEESYGKKDHQKLKSFIENSRKSFSSIT